MQQKRLQIAIKWGEEMQQSMFTTQKHKSINHPLPEGMLDWRERLDEHAIAVLCCENQRQHRDTNHKLSGNTDARDFICVTSSPQWPQQQ
eukprot:scaffold56130_cov22-Prasinocladus_malaysianus.AAC.1